MVVSHVREHRCDNCLVVSLHVLTPCSHVVRTCLILPRIRFGIYVQRATASSDELFELPFDSEVRQVLNCWLIPNAPWDVQKSYLRRDNTMFYIIQRARSCHYRNTRRSKICSLSNLLCGTGMDFVLTSPRIVNPKVLQFRPTVIVYCISYRKETICRIFTWSSYDEMPIWWQMC